MGKTVVVGDMHLKQRQILPRIDAALERHGARRVVLTGDYCDDWGAPDAFAKLSIALLGQWVEEKRAQGIEVHALVGNHDLCYLAGTNGPGTQQAIMPEVRLMLIRMDLAMAAEAGGFLITHGGVTAPWAAEFFDPARWDGAHSTAEDAARLLNSMFSDRSLWNVLDSCGFARGGGSIPGPLWADAVELRADPLEGVNQIVGHTPIRRCARIGREERSEVLWACDTFSLTSELAPVGDGSMLLVDDDGSVGVVAFESLGEGDWAQVAREYYDMR